MAEHTYRCSNCFEHTVTRDFDVSHVSSTCANCGEFARLVNEAVFDQYRAFEASPPDELDWERLDTVEKFLVSDQVARGGRSIEDFEVSDSQT